ncbi:diol dehydratase small subunit [Limosilactobacillus kribbianus]|uniref:diol dehydratase small subunit n=1 Tax=Limosilactobacillus kribbianus TaxID=2982695 RepID=UPI002263DD8A|nr:diol dehydratase small subunit [Limosilactobacillus kribbianus]
MSEVDDLVAKIMAQMGNAASTSSTSSASTSKEMTAKDYPLYQKHRDLVKTPKGKSLDDITLEKVVNDQVDPKELRITPEALKLQGEIAASAGRPAIQKNLQRAAELTRVPDDRVLQMYNALRPFRSTKQELLDIAKELRDKYNANVCAAWFEEAADYYESRKKLKGDN